MAAWGHTVNKVREKLSHLWRLTWDVRYGVLFGKQGAAIMMDLKSFVEETLCQIAEGIHGAQTRLRGSGALINPYYRAKENGPERIKNPEAFHSQTHLQTVAFDIAITASKSGKAGGGFGVAVIAASLKADGHRETSDSSTSRVRFEVVVDLPHQKPEQP